MKDKIQELKTFKKIQELRTLEKVLLGLCDHRYGTTIKGIYAEEIGYKIGEVIGISRSKKVHDKLREMLLEIQNQRESLEKELKNK